MLFTVFLNTFTDLISEEDLGREFKSLVALYKNELWEEVISSATLNVIKLCEQ